MNTHPLPKNLIKNYNFWKKNSFNKNKDKYKRLSKQVQKPKLMIISCCDSRIHPSLMFGDPVGNCFVYRNIANIIPNYKKTKDMDVLAALEYGLINLKISNLVILGHSNCGGIKHAHDMFVKRKFKSKLLLINKWAQKIKPIFNRKRDLDKNLDYFEKLNVKNSINNLFEISFIKKMIISRKLKIHGLWHDIGTGDLYFLNNKNKKFELIS
tara:strand:+ start:10050 stop:10682 length:633 start_codon:yes stop_codon:yes gene_type:complete